MPFLLAVAIDQALGAWCRAGTLSLARLGSHSLLFGCDRWEAWHLAFAAV